MKESNHIIKKTKKKKDGRYLVPALYMKNKNIEIISDDLWSIEVYLVQRRLLKSDFEIRSAIFGNKSYKTFEIYLMDYKGYCITVKEKRFIDLELKRIGTKNKGKKFKRKLTESLINIVLNDPNTVNEMLESYDLYKMKLRGEI